MTEPLAGADDAEPPPTEPSRPAPSHRRPSRRPAILSRRSLLGAGAVLAAGGVGAGIAAIQPARRRVASDAVVPSQLRSALTREQSLVADLDTALRRNPAQAEVLRAARDDHAAHSGALRSAIAAYSAPTNSTETSSTPAGATPAPPTAAQLRAAELAATAAAAAESAALAGADAALLASISASEATHAELLA